MNFGFRAAIAMASLYLIFLASARSAEATLPPSLGRPNTDGGPTKISVGVWVSDILSINSAAQTFTANVFVGLRWHDATLAHQEPEIKTLPLSAIWHPNMVIANQDGAVKRSLPETATVAPDGTVVYRQLFAGSFTQRLDLRSFPLDKHRFQIHFVVLGYRPSDIQFIPDELLAAAGFPQGAGIAKTLTVVDWRIDPPSARPYPYDVAPTLQVAGYLFEFPAAREVQYYILKVIFPLLLIVMMSWTVFWIDPANGSSQLSVAITSMLTLIAYRFAIGVEVPKLPYLTRLDAFILMSSILVFLSLLEVMLTTKLATANRLQLARNIDWGCRIIFPATFAVCAAVIFLR